jgi:DNA-binding transcriptional regulator YdaS (Cro superfamily)
MQTETAIRRAARLVGGPAALARRLGESVQTVSNWIARGEPPANKAVVIEAASGVSRCELRSDWRDYWPDKAEAVPAPAPDTTAEDRRGTKPDNRQVQVLIGFPDQRGTKPDRRGASMQAAGQGV